MSGDLSQKIQALCSSLAGSLVPARAPAKVNLRLKVLGRREDGYHLLSMLNCTTSLCDELGISFSPDGGIALTVEPEGVLAGESVESNLVVKAFRAFWRVFGFDHAPVGFSCFVTKRIPIGGGLGGGSSDAGAVLRVLTTVFGQVLCAELGLSAQEYSERVMRAALSCGADVPYAYVGGLCWVSGVGERVVQLSERTLRSDRILIVVPPAAVNTQRFYDHYRMRRPEIPLSVDDPMQRYVESHEVSLISLVENDFESVVCEMVPAVAAGLALARRFFPVSTALTGSGSALFSLIPETDHQRMSELSAAATERGYSVYPATLIPSAG
jgi:4-diphosphocytidyl-2-C-methyl-D-erythritol kinase